MSDAPTGLRGRFDASLHVATSTKRHVFLMRLALGDHVH
jgi:hypothetical protein